MFSEIKFKGKKIIQQWVKKMDFLF